MKKIFIVCAALLCGLSAAQAQDFELSNEGMAHWLEANSLLETARHETDFLKAAQTMEKVIATDSAVADVYYNLGVIYGKYAEMAGDNAGAYDNAVKHFRKYLTFNPDGRERIFVETEIGKLERLRSRIGWGIYTTPNGDVTYEGPMVDGKPKAGDGIYIVTDNFWKTRFEGTLQGSVGFLFKGEGTVYYDNGDNYTGSFYADNDIQKGPGVYIWANGDRLEADFGRSGVNGTGVFTWANGMRYEGEFGKNSFTNNLNGNGKLYDANGKLIYEGKFKKNKPVGRYNGPTLTAPGRRKHD